jgi:UDP-2,3-diacylglucosamine pyrophosphatase LpxH
MMIPPDALALMTASSADPLPEKPGALRFRAVWLSDIHLGTRGCKADILLDFLRHMETDYLYLVGDIVDGWQLRKRWYWPQEHNDVIQKLLRQARRGAKVVFLPGNHDEAARDYLGLNFGGVQIINETIHTTADGKKLYILHGDQFDAVMGCAKWLAHVGDAAYTFLLGVNVAFNYIRRKLGFSYWSLSAYLKQKVKNAVEHIGNYENFIADAARRHKADGVVCGHIHKAEIRMIGNVLYCNDGDWVESCTALVEHMDGRLQIINWPVERAALLGLTATASPT